MRKKDVVLLATVTSYEGLSMPTKSELRQFSELFVPLYQNSGIEARRLAVAALSQCKTLPPVVAIFIASQPIEIAAIFLVSSMALTDDMLISIARTQGSAHARAIAGRAELSAEVVDALVSLRQNAKAELETAEPEASTGPQAEIVSLPDHREGQRQLAEEMLRADLKQRVLFGGPSDREKAEDKAMREALLVRFARERQARDFTLVLADSLNSTLWLADRIMLDLSGEQLAETLVSLDVSERDAAYVLNRFYHHLDQSAALAMLGRIDPSVARDRIAAWVRADAYTQDGRTTPIPGAGNKNEARPALGLVADLLKTA